MRNENMPAGYDSRDGHSSGVATLKLRDAVSVASACKSGPLDDETRNVFQLLMAESRHDTAEPKSVEEALADPAELPVEVSGSIVGLVVAFGFGALAVRLFSR